MKRLVLILFLCSAAFGAAYSGSGAGTSGNPYIITTYEELLEVNQPGYSCDDDLSSYWKLANDIDASASASLDSGLGWKPIGDETNPFEGSFDGGGFAINGIKINRATTIDVGFFGYMTIADINNLGLTNVSIRGLAYVGGLAGYVSGGIEEAIITNCYTTGSASTVDRYDNVAAVGGLIGVADYATIERCYTTVDMNGTYTLGGGFISQSSANTIINDCYAAGDVNGGAYNIYGGFIGQSYADTTNCYSIGQVLAGVTKGGFCAQLVSGNIVQCHYDTNTSGCSDTGKGDVNTTVQMQTQSTFGGWDFTNIWGITEANYPTLQAFDETVCTVPNVVDMNSLDANSAIVGAGFVVEEITADWSNATDVNKIISQVPSAGEAACGSDVNYVVSRGDCVIPNVVGMNSNFADLAIVQAGYSLGTNTTAYSETVPINCVISQNPTSLETAACGTEVNYVESLGEEIDVNNYSTPVFDIISNIDVPEMNGVAIEVSATDADGNSIVYSANSLPRGAIFSGNTLTWDCNQAGYYTLKFYATDGELQGTLDVNLIVRGLCARYTMDDNTVDSNIVIDANSFSNGTSVRDTCDVAVTGQIDGALSFNGTSDYVDTNSTFQSVFRDSFTISFWANPIGYGDGTAFCGTGVSDGDILEISFGGDANEFYVYYYNRPTYQVDYRPTVSIPKNSWSMITVIIEKISSEIINIILYKNGVLIGESGNLTAAMADFNTGRNFYIGGVDYGAGLIYPNNGSLDDLRIYNKALDANAVADLFDENKGNFYTPVLDPIGAKDVNEGQQLTFDVNGTDLDPNDLTYSANALPENSTFSVDTFTFDPNYSQAGVYEVNFIVTDGELSDSEKVTITVNEATDPNIVNKPKLKKWAKKWW